MRKNYLGVVGHEKPWTWNVNQFTFQSPGWVLAHSNSGVSSLHISFDNIIFCLANNFDTISGQAFRESWTCDGPRSWPVGWNERAYVTRQLRPPSSMNFFRKLLGLSLLLMFSSHRSPTTIVMSVIGMCRNDVQFEYNIAMSICKQKR